jgi:CRISPR-associated protein Csm2
MKRYFDEGEYIRAELLDEEAKKMAESFVVYRRDRDGSIRRDNRGRPMTIDAQTLSSAQLRRFFGDFKQLAKKVEKQDFEKIKPLIKMVKSKASYAANPGNPKIPEQFKNFLMENVDAINTKKEFEAFMLHFEAVVGFFYGLEGVSTN